MGKMKGKTKETGEGQESTRTSTRCSKLTIMISIAELTQTVCDINVVSRLKTDTKCTCKCLQQQ